MRNTDLDGNAVETTWLSSLALAKSWPKGFSMTTRRHPPRSVAESPDRLRFWMTVSNRPGGIDR